MVVLTKHVDTANALQATQAQVIEVKHDRQNVSKRFSELQTEKTTIDTSLREERLKSENLQKENESLKANLQAKKEAERVAAEQTVLAAPVRTASAPQGNATCVAWLAAAGVTDMASAVELQRRENGSCDPQLYNRGGSDACGVAQELPCGKSGCGLPPNADGACQIRWMNSYVLGRYGSWAAALNHHDRMNWY